MQSNTSSVKPMKNVDTHPKCESTFWYNLIKAWASQKYLISHELETGRIFGLQEDSITQSVRTG